MHLLNKPSFFHELKNVDLTKIIFSCINGLFFYTFYPILLIHELVFHCFNETWE